MNDSKPAGNEQTVATRIGEFISRTRYEDLPPELLQRARLAMLDTLAAGLAGSRTPGSAIVRKYIADLGCGGTSTVFGSELRALPRFAAMANGGSINTDDFDDTYHPSRTHPSGPVTASVIAQAEQLGSSGRDVLAAFCVGSEVTCKVSQASSKEHYLRGFHGTSTFGVIGAAAGVSHLLKLSADKARAAIGIAASHSSGFRENFGSMAKALHSGHAAESAIVAGSLANLGFTSTPTVMEGSRGFFMATAGGYDIGVIETLGRPWGYVSPGVAIKPFPSGQISHPAMCKMLELVLKHDIKPDHVKRVHVKTNRLIPLNFTFHRPEKGLQGQLSMEFCLTAILLKRRAGLTEFTDEYVNQPEVQKTISKIDYTSYTDEEAEAGKYAFLTTFIDIELNDGRRISDRVDAAKGS
ncbi:MAG: hypothetical protein JWN13_2057, partial [Betaproteobacteria bacterium]|nr:hypothetical protein [Betaproteobacteria bacterium]